MSFISKWCRQLFAADADADADEGMFNYAYWIVIAIVWLDWINSRQKKDVQLVDETTIFRLIIQNPNALQKQLFTFKTRIITTYI